MSQQSSMTTTLLCLILLLFASGCKKSYEIQSPPVPEVTGDKIISVEEMTEDLEFAINVLGDVHPKTYRGFSQKQKQLIKSLRAKITEPMEAQKFYFIVNELFFSFKDAHTSLSPMKSKRNRFIDAELVWLHDGLYVKNASDKLKQGDKVIAIGNKSTSQLLDELEQMIPAENLHYVQYKAGRNLTHESYLDQLGIIQNDTVNYLIRRDDIELMLNVSLTNNSKITSEQISKPWVRFQVDKKLSLGIFTLDTCRYNDEFKNKLNDFFAEVKKHNIRHIAVDVRNNSGGNSRVIEEFLSYMNIKKYKSFSMGVRYSEASKKLANSYKDRGYKEPFSRSNIRDNRKCPDPELMFNGKLYILVSAKTFSSANWFAVGVKDNELGMIIGEPTGNQPTSYGDVLGFQLPNTGFRFICSYKKWIRPDKSNDPEDAIYPDVIAYTTIEDIIQNRDTQIEKLKEIISF